VVQFWRFADAQSLDGLVQIVPTYHSLLAWIAGLLAVCAGFALFPTLERVRSAPTLMSRRAWLLGGAFTMGVGFWGTQNMALIGMELPTAFSYRMSTGALALLPVVGGCAMAIHVLAEPSRSLRRLTLGALSLAAGMAAMHYTLMEAIVGDVLMTYDPYSFGVSLILGFGFSFVALYVNRALDHGQRSWVGWLLGGIVFGVTLLGNHFSAMAGVSFFDDPAVLSTTTSATPAVMIPVIGGSVLFLVSVYWLGSLIDGRLSEANAAVLRSEARHRAVIETMLDAHIVVDSKSLIRAFNPAAEGVFGWPAGEVIGQPVSVLLHAPGVRANHRWETRAAVERAQATPGRRWVHADGGRRRDGTLFPIEVAVTPFFVAGERLVSCTVRDLSDSWANEARTRRLAAAIEQASDAVCLVGLDRRIQYVNPQYERQTGLTADEALGAPLGDDATPGSIYREIWESVEQGRVWSGQLCSRRRDGKSFEEELTLTPVLDNRGTVSGYVGVMRDVSRRNEAEMERQRLAEALRHCKDSIEILDSQGRIAYVNEAFEAATGCRLADIRGSRPEALADFTPAGESYDEMTRAVRAGRSWSGTLRTIDLRGDLHEEEVTVSPIRDERGQLSGYVVVKRDISHRQRSAALAEQRQRLESIGELADGIAHELSAPMASLENDLDTLGNYFGNLDRLLTDLASLGSNPMPLPGTTIAACLQSVDAPFLRREIALALERSSGCARQLSGIIHAMHEVCHETRERSDIDINRAIRSAVTVTASEWRPVAEIRTEFDADLPVVSCVPSEIGLVLLTLLSNAAQAIAANSGGLRGKGLITLTSRRLGDAAEIRIAHSGSAITAEQRAQLFDPQAASTPDGKLHGLALVHQIVTLRHGGTIALEQGDRGPVFCIRLPIAGAGVVTAAA
jgi:PAS domain S-box-containing protein